MTNPLHHGARRIDVHHHIIPKDYRQLLRERGIRPGGIDLPHWSATESLALMEAEGISTAILSVSTPGVWFGDAAEARYWARRVNEEAAETVAHHPDRFGFFATLTLPDVEGAVREAEHSLGELGADGVVLLANTDGVYLGAPRFEKLLQALDELGATVFVHPGELPAEPAVGIPSFTADFLLDTTRTAISLLSSGAMEKYPRIRFVLAHAGGFVPYILDRMLLAQLQQSSHLEQAASLLDRERTVRQYTELVRRFWFDVALSSTPAALPSLLAVAAPHHVVWGSDFPFAPAPAVDFMRTEFARAEIPEELRQRIEHQNALELFPRLRGEEDGDYPAHETRQA